MADDRTILAILAALSFIPGLLFVFWLRNHERHDKEPLRAVFGAFIYGGSGGVAIALLLHVLFEFGYHNASDPLKVGQAFLAAVIIAPIVEEFGKGLGLGIFRGHIREPEDGIIYGACLGLGFAATENFVYGLAALAEGGFGVAIGTIAIRVFTSMLLHASASAILGFGYGIMTLRDGVALEVLPHYLLAVLLHAAYNFMVGTNLTIGFLAAILMVAIIFGTLRKRIKQFDAAPHEHGFRQ